MTDFSQRNNDRLFDIPDLSQLEVVSGGNKGFIKKMVRLFIKQTENGFNKINKNFDAGNIKGVREEAHRMLSPARHLRLNNLILTLESIEIACAENDQQADLELMVKKLHHQLVLTKNELKQYLS